MPVSLYTATVGTFLQILPQVAGMIDKAEAHCTEQGLSSEALTGACLSEDMWNFAKQVTSTATHSAGAIAAVKVGSFSPDRTPAPLDFAGLRAVITDAIASLQAKDPIQIEALVGRDTYFAFGDRRMDFTVEDFLLSFSMPNFYFHAATSYNILRNNGVTIGKMDFLGRPRIKA